MTPSGSLAASRLASSDAFLISEFHLSGAKNKKILTSISELAGSPDSQLEGIVGCLTLTAHSESSQKISPPTFGSTMTLLTFCATPTVQHYRLSYPRFPNKNSPIDQLGQVKKFQV